MVRNPYKGKFIVIEGIDGSGSSTQVSKIHDFFRVCKLKSHATKEPTNYLIGGLIRSWLTGDWSSSPLTLQLLFTADRAHHLEKEIIPMLQKGFHVICDRYSLSTVAYGSPDISDTKWLQMINDHFLEPDILIYLRVSVREAMRRMGASRNGFELFEKEKELERVAKQYEKLAKDASYVVSIDGEQDEAKVSQDIINILNRKFHFMD